MSASVHSLYVLTPAPFLCVWGTLDSRCVAITGLTTLMFFGSALRVCHTELGFAQSFLTAAIEGNIDFTCISSTLVLFYSL